MKIGILIGLLKLLSGFSSVNFIGQCNAEALSDACVPRLAEGFNFLKRYKIDSEGGALDKVEYSYVFTRGTQYMLTLCTEETGPTEIVIQIMDANRNQIASNRVNGQTVNAISYACQVTGIYYMHYSFAGTTGKCGGSALGFKR